MSDTDESHRTTAEPDSFLSAEELDSIPLEELRKRLQDMGIDTKNMFERFEMKEAYIQVFIESGDGWTKTFDPDFVRES